MNRLVALLELDVPLIAQLWVDGATPEDVRKAVECGMDIAELRFDQFATLSAEHIERQLERFPDVAKIATLRSAAEGGGWRGSDADRTKLFERVAPRVDGIDIELSSGHAVTAVRDLCRMNDCLMIVSYHNYESTPASDDLRDIVMRSKDCGADIVKIATWAGDSEAAGRLANLLMESYFNLVSGIF